ATSAAARPCGCALTPSSAPPWPAAATTIAAPARGATATPSTAATRGASPSIRPSDPRGFVFPSKARRAAAPASASEAAIRATTASSGIESQRPAGDDEERLVGRARPGLVDAAEEVAVRAAERCRGDDAEPDLVGDGDRRARALRRGGRSVVGLGLDRRRRLGLDPVRDPQREAVDDDAALRRRGRDRLEQPPRLLDRRPAGRSLVA